MMFFRRRATLHAFLFCTWALLVHQVESGSGQSESDTTGYCEKTEEGCGDPADKGETKMAALSVFLIGKTGHGKSSTGNFLLGREAFVVSDSTESVTSAVQMATATAHGRQINVIDGPGLSDTRMDNVAVIRKTCEDMKQGVASNPRGIGAFLLVLKYEDRFTDEEKSTVDSLKSILGENFVRDHCVIVFTHGEMFDINTESSGLSFTEWREQQKGALGELLAESGHRSVLVYKNRNKMTPSIIDEILGHVDNLMARHGAYTLDMFNGREQEREKLIVRTDAPRLQQTMDAEVTSQRAVLTQILNGGGDHDAKLSRLSSLRGDVTVLKQRIVREAKGTDVLNSHIQACDSLLASVTNQEAAIKQAKANLAEQQRLAKLKAEQARVQAEAERVRRRRKKKKKFLGLF